MLVPSTKQLIGVDRSAMGAAGRQSWSRAPVSVTRIKARDRVKNLKSRGKYSTNSAKHSLRK